MASVTFDTLAFVKTLEKAGYSQQQSEAQAKAQAGIFSEVLVNSVATKSEITELKLDISAVKVNMADVKDELKVLK